MIEPTAVREMTEFPAVFGLTAEQTRDLLVAAGQAPSLHNTQPWLFRLTPDAIEVYADPLRRLTVSDPDGRELRLACGAAMLNLRLALAALDVRALVTVFPDRSHPDLVAVVRHGGHKPATADIVALAGAIPRRHTNRGRFESEPVPASHRHALRRAAMHEGAWLQFVDDAGERDLLTALASTAQRARLSSPHVRAEIATWTAEPGRRDGVPASAGGPQLEPRSAGDPLLMLLIAHSSGPTAEVRTGAAMQRVLLAATAVGLATAFLSQLVEGLTMRERMRRLVGTSRPPEVVLQVGRATPLPVTARLPVEELILAPTGNSDNATLTSTL